ncbi:MAG: CvpA family protein [Oscillospiraceae bacterium]|jgi:uncharacterized membrane protein required for colicin V production|nr:CvpA family protein [Oscillospiraceae bacterium]
MSIAIDVSLVVIVAFCGWRGYKSGIIRGVCGILALAVSIFGANLIAATYSGEFTSMLRPFVGGIVDKTFEGILQPDTEDGEEPEDGEAPEGAYEITLATLRKLGLFDASSERLAEQVSEDTDASGYGLAGAITDKLCDVLAFVAVFGVAFILLAIVFAVAGNLLNFVFKFPGFELLDSLFGILFGLVRGLVIVFIIALLLRYLGIVSAEKLSDTKILKYLIENNPIANILKI